VNNIKPESEGLFPFQVLLRVKHMACVIKRDDSVCVMIDSVKQDPYSEGNTSSYSPDIYRILWNPEVH